MEELLIYFCESVRTHNIIRKNNLNSMSKVREFLRDTSIIEEAGALSVVEIAIAYDKIKDIIKCSQQSDLVSFLEKQ